MISAHLQDAVLQVGDMAYLPREKRFAAVANRFDWADGARTAERLAGSGYTRRRAALRFERVLGAKVQGIDLAQEGRGAVAAGGQLRAGRAAGGMSRCTFAGGGAIRLDVECIEAELKDLGPVWRAASMPTHPDDTSDALGRRRKADPSTMPMRLEHRRSRFRGRVPRFPRHQARDVAADVDAAVRAIIAEVRARRRRGADRAHAALRRARPGATSASASPRPRSTAAVAACDGETMARRWSWRMHRIESHHQRQLPEDDRYTDALGVELGTRWTAVESVGLYVPGGTASYPSSVLMNAVPAKVAGVPRIVMVVPAPGGEINPLVLAAAQLAGVTRSTASAARRRSRRSPTAPRASRRSPRSSAPAMPMSRRPSGRCSARSAST